MIVKRGSEWCLLTKDGKKTLGCHPSKEKAEEQERVINQKKREARYVHLKAAVSGVIRTAIFEEREHVVVPVIALVEGVIHAVNAEKPELVLAAELEKTPQGWNGRPVLPDHPSKNGQRTSANDPRTLEQMAFGRIFNARVEDSKLKVEAWLDRARAEKLGGEAQRTLERITKGEMVEVSVGAFIIAEAAKGVFKGEPFDAVWREIVPDHLAMLPEGTTGACSVEMGCGAPRAAEAKEGKRVSIKERIASLAERFKVRQAEEVTGDTDNDLRSMLHDALFASEPAFLGIEAVIPEESVVIYAVAPEGELKMFKRSFTKGDDGVELGDDAAEVKMVTKFETMAAADCGCGGKNKETPAAKEAGMEKKELVKKVLARKGTPFVEADATLLEGFSEERLTALAAEEPAKETPPAPAAAPAVPAEPKKDEEKTPEQVTAEAAKEREVFLAKFPDIKAVLDAAATRAAARRTELVAAISATKQDVYTEDALKAMPVEQLEATLKLLAAGKSKVDFSLNAPRNAQREEEGVPAAPDLHAAIRAARNPQQSKAS